jgi:hypothetical protein
MGIARHGRFRVGGGKGDQRIDQCEEVRSDRMQLFLTVEAEIHEHLVVARACGVDALARLTDQGSQFVLDPGMHVFIGRCDDELAGLNLAQESQETMPDRTQIIGAEDADMGEHGSMSQRPPDVMAGESLVKGGVGPRLEVFRK